MVLQFSMHVCESFQRSFRKLSNIHKILLIQSLQLLILGQNGIKWKYDTQIQTTILQ